MVFDYMTSNVPLSSLSSSSPSEQIQSRQKNSVYLKPQVELPAYPCLYCTPKLLTQLKRSRGQGELQRMENELDTPSWHSISSQSCGSLDFGHDKLFSWEDWHNASPVYAKLRMPHFPEDYNMAAASVSPWVFRESVIFREEPDGKTYGGRVTHLNPVIFGPMWKEQDFNYAPEPEGMCTTSDWPSKMPVFIPIQAGSHPQFLNHPSDSWRETSLQPVESPTNFQRWPLTGVKRAFPESQLEQLREKIQAQKHRHANVFPTSFQARSGTPQTLPWKHVPKRSVSKMKLGASKPAHPGQVSASNPDPSDTHHAVSHKFIPKRKSYRVRFALSTPIDPHQRDKTRVTTNCQVSSQSPSLGKHLKGQGLTEKTQKSEHIPPSPRDINNQKGAAPLRGNSQNSPESSAQIGCGGSESFHRILNFLKNLQSHVQEKADHKRTRPQSPKITSTKKAGKSECHSKSQNAAVRRNLQFVSGGKNLSSRMGSSRASKAPGKENACQGTLKKTNKGALRPCVTAEMQELMNQKVSERKKRCLEAKIYVKKALESRDKLRDVKEKEIPFKKLNAKALQMSFKNIGSEQQSHLSKAQKATENKREAAQDHEKQILGTVLNNKELQDRTSHDIKTPVTVGASKSGVNPALPVFKSISPRPLKQQGLDPPRSLPPALTLQSHHLENLRKTQSSIVPNKESNSVPYQHNQARIRILEATAKVLKERIEFLTEKLNLPGVCLTLNGKSEKCMNVQSTNISSVQECPTMIVSSCSLVLGQSSSPTALGTPGGNEPEVNKPLSDREKEMTQKGRKDGVEMETKAPAVLSPAAPAEMLSCSSPRLNKQPSPCLEEVMKPIPDDFTLTEDSEMEEWAPEDKFTCIPSFFTRSSQKEFEKQDSFIDPSGIQMEEELSECSLGISESYNDIKIQDFPTRKNEFSSSSSKHMEEYESCNKYSKDVCMDYLSSMQQKSLNFLQKMKLHQIKQERELEILKHRAELEAAETQKSLDELVLRNHLKSLHGSHIHRTELDNKAEKWKMPKTHGGLESTDCLTGLSSMGRSYSSRTSSPTVSTWESEPRRNLLGCTDADKERRKQDCTTSSHSTTWFSSAFGYPSSKVFSKEDSMDSSSQKNEIYRSSLFDHFSLRMTDQYLKEEELRAQYQIALLKLREKALEEKVIAELSWLEQQKACLGNKRDHSLMTEEQHQILMDLKKEQAELKHQQNIYEVAHQERKFLLTQQKDLSTIQQSTSDLQSEFTVLASRHQFSSPWSEAIEIQKSEDERIFRLERLVSSPEGLLSSTSSYTERSSSVLPDLGENLKCYENTHLLAEREIQGKPDEDSCLQPQWLKGGKDRSMVSNIPDHREQTLGQFVKNDNQENKEPAEQHCTSWGCRQQESSLEIKQDSYQKPTIRTEEYNSKIDFKPNMVKKRSQSEVIASLANGERYMQGQKNELNLSKLERSLAGQEGGQTFQQEDSVINSRKNQETSGLGSAVIKSPKVESEEDKRRKQRMKGKSQEVPLKTIQMCHTSAIQECKKDQEKKSEYTQYDENYLYNKCDTTTSDSLKSGSVFSTSLESLSSDTISPCNSPLDLKSDQSYSSFSEFQKVTAFLVNVSDSLISASDSETESSQNTDVNEWQAFTDQQPLNELSSPLPNPSVTPRKVDELILAVNSDEKQPDRDFPLENCQDLQTQGNNNISSNDSPFETNIVSLSGSRKHKLSLLWTELPLSQDSPSGKLSDILSENTYVAPRQDKEKSCSEHKVCVEPKLSSFSFLDDFSKIDVDLKQQGPTISLDEGKDQKDLEIEDVLVDGTNKKETGFSLPEIYFMSFPPPNLKANCQPPSLPLKMSQRKQNSLVKKAKAACEENPEERLISNKVSKYAVQQLSTDFNSMPAIPGPQIFQDGKIVQSIYEHKADKSDIHHRISESHEVVISPSGSLSGLIPEAEHCPAMRVDSSTHMERDGLPTLQDSILSEILSPVDEVLSYGSAGLPSPTQKVSSFPRETLPSPPPDFVLWANVSDIDFNSEDFPSLPEEMIFPEDSKNVQDEDSSIQTGELSSLSDEILLEEFSPIPLDVGNSCSVLDEHSPGWEEGRERSLERKEELLRVEPQQDIKRKQKVGCWYSPALSRSASKSPASFFKPSIDEDGKNPLGLEDAENREHTQPETLKFKETSHFEGKHWTSLVPDEAKNDHHKEDLERVKHSECDMDYDEIFRSDKMSYLLADYIEKPSDHNYQDSVHDESSLRSNKCYDEVRVEYRFLERKPEIKFNNRDGSMTTVATYPETLMFRPTEMESYFIQSESERLLNKDLSGCLNGQKEQPYMAPIKNEAEKLLEDVHPMEEKEINFKNSVMGSQLDPRQKTYGIVDSVSTELTRKILWDALAVFAELARQ
ncbi:coiled-coil domain-containing protein 187 isoform X2 [Antechinus flavipes]|uniref:coiled-coil domain-containing protein 187 isoform X2 n=1 Tax=Antechinus flavipes TaxID=38775 RepID=UPI0022367889|nr:coiled-coil domain-containing protein 187 isoform X2 [Antechinus flavipes]